MANSLLDKFFRKTAPQSSVSHLMEDVSASSSVSLVKLSPSRTQIYAQYAKNAKVQRSERTSRAREFRTSPKVKK